MAGNRYYRCRQDKSGCEPKRLFTLAEFMIYDKDGSGTVNEDECMEMMYARFGKENVERMTEDLFKHDADGDRNISYQECAPMQRNARCSPSA